MIPFLSQRPVRNEFANVRSQFHGPGQRVVLQAEVTKPDGQTLCATTLSLGMVQGHSIVVFPPTTCTSTYN